MTTLRQTVAKQSELLERVVKALIEGIAVFRANKQKSIAVSGRYLRGASDEILDESYQSTLAELEPAPMPSLAVSKSGLDILSLEYPQARQTGAAAIIDASIMRRIEPSGFIDALYKKVSRRAGNRKNLVRSEAPTRGRARAVRERCRCESALSRLPRRRDRRARK